jgi:uncharacterized protein YwqG
VNDIVTAVREMPELSRVADQLVALRRNSIRITATKTADEKLDRGVSKLGGVPDLPDGFAWPMREVMARGTPMRVALPFVAQLRMDVLSPADADRLLPPSGILYFFYLDELHLSSIGAWSMTATADSTNRLILHYDGDLARLRRADPPKELPASRRYGACALTFAREITLPNVETAYIHDRGSADGTVVLTEDEWTAYADLHYEKRANLMMHQMLGHYDNEQPYPAGTDTDARLLLQVDSQDNNGMSWGRDGKLYFFIHERDLVGRRWDTVWTREQ